MSLTHCFAVVPRDSNQKIIEMDMELVQISDSIIQYIGDSLRWIYTSWNGKKVEKGISYYGYSVIEYSEISKFQNIIEKWRELFLLAPEEFCLTCEYIPDENKYRKIKIKKEVLVRQLEALLIICEKAIERKGKILHNGI